MLFFFSSDCYNWLSGPISVGFFVLLICTSGFGVFFITAFWHYVWYIILCVFCSCPSVCCFSMHSGSFYWRMVLEIDIWATHAYWISIPSRPSQLTKPRKTCSFSFDSGHSWVYRDSQQLVSRIKDFSFLSELL